MHDPICNLRYPGDIHEQRARARGMSIASARRMHQARAWTAGSAMARKRYWPVFALVCILAAVSIGVSLPNECFVDIKSPSPGQHFKRRADDETFHLPVKVFVSGFSLAAPLLQITIDGADIVAEPVDMPDMGFDLANIPIGEFGPGLVLALTTDSRALWTILCFPLATILRTPQDDGRFACLA